ncbi:hypothetical protein CRI85_02515 [Leuconostoc pseudomesenteroides]|uniref:hypothetical protein n=1 Tax=Leuconostoc pseudomesenteroides TaxID=33968 RepID=UPI001E5CC592|nr:hypothetical protein [Leuconostoc pseudomesenteroides]MCC8439222.1 hypothetical protein [Leuconostoc pseudomesenteroides]
MTETVVHVTREQLDLIKELKFQSYTMFALAEDKNDRYTEITNSINELEEKAILRYLGGDKTVEFKVKEPLYRLWGKDFEGEKAYFARKGGLYAPATSYKKYAFTAPLEEIKKWQTPDWEIEKVDD